MPITRRDFIKTSAIAAGGTMLGQLPEKGEKASSGKLIKITEVSSNFEREPLIRPFGFKGGYMREIWQSVAILKVNQAFIKSVLVPRASFGQMHRFLPVHSESGGNALMYAMTEYGLSC